MLYFSKLKLLIIYFVIVFLSLLSLANFFENEDNILLSKKVNLGLDLQGGSYLLLEVDSQPALKQKLQDKLIYIRKALKNYLLARPAGFEPATYWVETNRSIQLSYGRTEFNFKC